jgi:hypothetical protein
MSNMGLKYWWARSTTILLTTQSQVGSHGLHDRVRRRIEISEKSKRTCIYTKYVRTYVQIAEYKFLVSIVWSTWKLKRSD